MKGEKGRRFMIASLISLGIACLVYLSLSFE